MWSSVVQHSNARLSKCQHETGAVTTKALVSGNISRKVSAFDAHCDERPFELNLPAAVGSHWKASDADIRHTGYDLVFRWPAPLLYRQDSAAPTSAATRNIFAKNTSSETPFAASLHSRMCDRRGIWDSTMRLGCRRRKNMFKNAQLVQESHVAWKLCGLRPIFVCFFVPASSCFISPIVECCMRGAICVHAD